MTGVEGSAAALQRAIADACLGMQAGAELASDLGAFLERRGASHEDVEAATSQPRRLAVYRSLVRNGLSAVVLRMLPRTRARMNAACTGRFDADFARFVDEVGPRTHYLRDVPFELVAWAEPTWRSDPSVPAYLPDLASFELAHFAIAASEATSRPDHVTEVALDRCIAFSPSARLLRYAWGVHALSDDDGSLEEPAPRAAQLLAYRDDHHAVRWLELTPLAALIVERLQAKEPLGVALVGACAAMGTDPRAVLPDVARVLADLGERGVILGGERAPEGP
jgi:hypothetical protein